MSEAFEMLSPVAEAAVVRSVYVCGSLFQHVMQLPMFPSHLTP